MTGTHRIIGTEIEYGISTPATPQASPILTSTEVVKAYARAHAPASGKRARWDYEPESPLRDTRGYDLRRYRMTPVVDPDAIGAANIILDNGARFYVDHAHPEYSAPETTSPLAAVIADRAGDRIILEAAKLAADSGELPEVRIYRNNVDGKGASYGAHENYLIRRDVPFEAFADALVPFFVTRQVYAGAGRVGLGEAGQETTADAGFQISQRADYIETEISLETTLNRGIINTRDEPHADGELWRRLHVIIGDANMSETATFLKLGATCLVLSAIEDGVDFSDLALREPVKDVRRVSRDLTCTAKLQHDDHVTWRTAVEIQREYLERCARYDDDGEVARLWGEVLDLLADDPRKTSHLLDWTAKLGLLDGLRARAGGDWRHPKLALVDLQYADIDPARGLHRALERRGSMRRLTTEEQVAHAAAHPPEDTRAFFRGELLRRFPDDVVAASWNSAIVRAGGPETRGGDRDDTGDLVKMRFQGLASHTREEVGGILEEAADAADLIRRLRGRGLAGLH